MILAAKNLSRNERKKKDNPYYGVYVDGEYDQLASTMARYPTAVVTLETALSLYGIIDEFVSPPFYLSFSVGYRPVKEKTIAQIWENVETRLIGAVVMERDGIKFLCYDKERLLIELFRREKLVSIESFQAAIFYYRKAANDGTLNLPKMREYCKALPKGKMIRERIKREVL